MRFSLTFLATLFTVVVMTVDGRPSLQNSKRLAANRVCGPKNGDGIYAAGSNAYQGCSAGASASLSCCNALYPNRPNKCNNLANNNQANCDALGSDTSKKCPTATDSGFQSCCNAYFGVIPEGGEGSGCTAGSLTLQ